MLDLVYKYVTSTRKTIVKVVDAILFQYRSVTNLFEEVHDDITKRIRLLHKYDMPLSSFFNNLYQFFQNKIRLIMDMQKDLLYRLIQSWNGLEKGEVHLNKRQSDIALEYPLSEVYQGVIGLSAHTSERISADKVKSITFQAHTNFENIVPYYGKAWGVYTKGVDNLEDSIRYSNNDGMRVLDGQSTFWECEAVVLEESTPNIIHLQPVCAKDIILYAYCKMIFKTPIHFNAITIRPYHAASNAYYMLTKIEISDGQTTIPVYTQPIFIFNDTTIPLIIPEQFSNNIRSLTLSFEQHNGYYIKYTVAKFRTKHGTFITDVTGPHVAEMAHQSGTLFSRGLAKVIENADDWIMNYVLPGVIVREKPEMVRSFGMDGFLTIPSSESARKRYSIGIIDIEIYNRTYHPVTEWVSEPQPRPAWCNAVSLSVQDQGNVKYMLSFDNGLSWYHINPLGRLERWENDILVPQVLYINSDISLERKHRSLTKMRGFVETTNKTVLVRCVLFAGTVAPKVFSWNLKWRIV